MSNAPAPYTVTRKDTPEDFVNAIRERYQLTSDYQVAQRLRVSHQAVTRYRRGTTGFDEAVSARVAHLLQIPHAYVMAKMEEHRARTEAGRTAWRDAAAVLRKLAAVFLCAVGVQAVAPAPVQASGANAVYYVKSRSRRHRLAAAGMVLAATLGLQLQRRQL